MNYLIDTMHSSGAEGDQGLPDRVKDLIVDRSNTVFMPCFNLGDGN
ncbi:MAG: hypothetical protein IPN33_14435 [Saprospiraceae bacterium]|nr:hypothetical protein [Saprospiraceae bacterium]